MIDIDKLRAEVRAQADRVAIALLGDRCVHIGAELRFGRKGSVSVVIAGSKQATWYDHQSREGGDLFDLIQREHRCDFIPACEIAAEILAQTYDQPPRSQSPHRELSGTEKHRSALALYDEAKPFRGTRAEAYLRETRCIDLDALPDLSHVLRFHPSCPFRPGQRQSCLLALFRDIVTDAPRAIQRIAIARDLTKIDALALGPTSGAVIKLSPDEEVLQSLCAAEGVETGLSAMMMAHRGAWLRPMWVLGGTSGLLGFPVINGVSRLTIAADHDPIDPKLGYRPGEHAASHCERRWLDAGREVATLMPNEIGDFNDIIVRRRRAIR
jgi:hypothetical protein